MSDPPPPPPPPPPPRYPYQQSYQYSYPYNTSNYGVPTYGNAPPPTAAGYAPPPLYSYNAGAHHYSSAPAPLQPPSPYSSTPLPPQQHYTTEHHNIHESSLWKCDTCNVTLESETRLQAHLQSHISCTRCDFRASRKVVNAHFSAKHGKFAGGGFKTVTIRVPGTHVQRFTICVGNHPQDIQKWIEERKRRFPRQRRAVSAVVQTEEGEQNDERKEMKKETKPNAALGSLLDGYGSSSSDSDGDNEAIDQAAKGDAQLQGKADMDSTDADNARDDTKSSPVADSCMMDPLPSNYRTRPCRYFTRNGTCRNGDACNFSHEAGPPPLMKKTIRKQPRRSNNTLLRKLLEKDARREATLTLQLLGYLADCNYLQEQRK